MKTLTELSMAGITNQQLSGKTARTVMEAQQQGISGAVGVMGAFGRINQAQTDEHFIRLFAKGLDSSRTGEDLNRFMQVTAELATRTGFVSQEMEDRLLAGAKDQSQFALEMSKQAAMDYSERAGAATGLEGQVGMQFLTSRESISKIAGLSAESSAQITSALQTDTTLASELNRLTEEDAADEKLMRSYAKRMGENVTADDVKKLISSKDLSKVKARMGMSPKAQKAYQQLVEESRAAGKIVKPSEEIYSYLKGTMGVFGDGGEKGMAMISQMVAEETGLKPSADIAKATEKLGTQPKGVGEAALKGIATAENAKFEGFQQFREQFENDAKAMSTAQATTVLAMKAIEDAASKAAGGLEGFSVLLNNVINQYNRSAPAGEQIPLFMEAKPSSGERALQMGKKLGISAKDS
jgi:hypothetical protein